MEMWDLSLVETGSGGDFTLNGNDLAVCKSIENAVYLSLFGGNVEADTVVPRIAGAQDFSWWGNTLFLNGKKTAQFNSLTERTLNTTPLTSAGRVVIENAIRRDLNWLGGVTVNVVIVSTDRINVTLKIVLPSGATKVASFALVRNPHTGDFDLNDFNFNDFF